MAFHRLAARTRGNPDLYHGFYRHPLDFDMSAVFEKVHIMNDMCSHPLASTHGVLWIVTDGTATPMDPVTVQFTTGRGHNVAKRDASQPRIR